jgi:hypothetical protein
MDNTLKKLNYQMLAEMRNSKLVGMDKAGVYTTLKFDNGATITFDNFVYVNLNKKSKDKQS